MKVVTLTGSEANLDDRIVEQFRSGVRGNVLVEGENAYDQARVVFNAMIDKRPALIIQCSGTADVIAAVDFACENNLLLAVRSGGHNVAGNSICDGGLLIDMQHMCGVQVDPWARVARVQGGATLGDLDHETQVFGLAAPVGVVSATGVAGLTLGGGFGWLRGKHGLSIDNLNSVDMVTADGQFRRASDDENRDLFWGIRGGGGNFGVVTSFEFRLHPVGPQVMFCAPMYAARDAVPVLRGWREFMKGAPDEFTAMLFLQNIPAISSFPRELHGQPVVVLAGVYIGPVDQGERFVQPLRELGAPLFDASGIQQFTALQSSSDALFTKGTLHSYYKSLYLDSFDDDVISTLMTAFNERPATLAPFVVQDLRGASMRVAMNATAFGDRSAPYLLELNSSWTDPQESERIVAWTRQCWADFQKFSSSGGLYLNHAGFHEEGEELVKKTFGTNYDRLQTIKKKYDPTNLFRLNHNIVPG